MVSVRCSILWDASLIFHKTVFARKTVYRWDWPARELPVKSASLSQPFLLYFQGYLSGSASLRYDLTSFTTVPHSVVRQKAIGTME
jgi:hypothetical protein